MGWAVLLMQLPSSCKNEESPPPDVTGCTIAPNLGFYTQDEMTSLIRPDVIAKLASANQSDAEGALGRNKNGYFHVRFQTGISALADYAVEAQNGTALEMFIRAVEYSFRHQNADGDFQLVVPAELSQSTPTLADRISGIAFFYASLGAGLLALQDNAGYLAQTASRKRIDLLIPRYQLTLDFLKANKAVLVQADAEAPNRLFFDALAFYGMGRFLNDEEAMKKGVEFAALALAQKQSEGFFKEGGGYDSSYQGVSLANGFRLLTILRPTEAIRQTLYNELSCGSFWESGRIKSSGEISTEGNARVYPGGETFLGEEKSVAYTSVILAFYNMYFFSGKKTYNELAEKILTYYVL